VCFLILRNLTVETVENEKSQEISGINNNINKTKNILGLAKKAGAITAGTELVIESVRKKRACHIFICSDASPGTLKKLSDKAKFYQVPVTNLDMTMSELAHCVGLQRLTAAVALTNINFLKLLNLTDSTVSTVKSTEVYL